MYRWSTARRHAAGAASGDVVPTGPGQSGHAAGKPRMAQDGGGGNTVDSMGFYGIWWWLTADDLVIYIYWPSKIVW